MKQDLVGLNKEVCVLRRINEELMKTASIRSGMFKNYNLENFRLTNLNEGLSKEKSNLINMVNKIKMKNKLSHTPLIESKKTFRKTKENFVQASKKPTTKLSSKKVNNMLERLNEDFKSIFVRRVIQNRQHDIDQLDQRTSIGDEVQPRLGCQNS